jgi:hypothetical protein
MKDESLLGKPIPKVFFKNALWLVFHKLGDDYHFVGQSTWNGINFNTVRHLFDEKLEFYVLDPIHKVYYPVDKIINISNHAHAPDCPSDCSLDDFCKFTAKIPTERMVVMKEPRQFMSLGYVKDLKPGDPLSLHWRDCDSGEPMTYTCSVVEATPDWFKHDAPTVNGVSGAAFMCERTGQLFGFHKGGASRTYNRAVRLTTHAIQNANNAISTKTSKKE